MGRKKKRKKKSLINIIGYKDEKKEETFDSGLTMYEECPHKRAVVVIPEEIWNDIVLMRDELSGGKEFTLYLKIRKEPPYYYIEDYYIPKQTVTSANVEIEDDNIPYPEGALHYHPFEKGDFWSHTDRESNHNKIVSLVIDKNDRILAHVMQKMPCGVYMSVKASVLIVRRHFKDVDEIRKEFKRNVKEKKVEVRKYSPYDWSEWVYGGGRDTDASKEYREKDDTDASGMYLPHGSFFYLGIT